MNFKQMEKIIKADGGILKSIQGSHNQYVHPSKPGKVTIPNHGKKDLTPGVVKSILKQAVLK